MSWDWSRPGHNTQHLDQSEVSIVARSRPITAHLGRLAPLARRRHSSRFMSTSTVSCQLLLSASTVSLTASTVSSVLCIDPGSAATMRLLTQNTCIITYHHNLHLMDIILYFFYISLAAVTKHHQIPLHCLLIKFPLLFSCSS